MTNKARRLVLLQKRVQDVSYSLLSEQCVLDKDKASRAFLSLPTSQDKQDSRGPRGGIPTSLQRKFTHNGPGLQINGPSPCSEVPENFT